MKKRGHIETVTPEPRRSKRRKAAEEAVAGEDEVTALHFRGGVVHFIPGHNAGPQDHLQQLSSGATHGGASGSCEGNAVRSAPCAGRNGPPPEDSSDRRSAQGLTDEGSQGSDQGAVGQAEPSIPDIQVAATQLVKLTGLTPEAAVHALQETKETVFSQNNSGHGEAILNAWVEEAQVWIACNMEVQGEIEDVRTAMEESLQEYEAAKAADDMPLSERPPEYLRDRFLPGTTSTSGRKCGAPGSILIRHISAFVCYRALFAPGAHKAPLVKLFELESKCHRWYPTKGTSRFWEQVAEDCTAAAVNAAASTPALRAEGWVSCDQACTGCTSCAAALAKDGNSAGPSCAASAASGPVRTAVSGPVGAEVLTALGSFAERKARSVEHEVCKMPSVPGQIPDVFTALDDPPVDSTGSDAEYMELLDSATKSERQVETL